MKPIFKISLFLYAALLLAPGALKSAHIFADHQHFFCDHSSDSHIHQKSTDCDLFSFQQHSFLAFELFSPEAIEPERYFFISSHVYSFVFKYHYSNYLLRGPPTASAFC